MAFPCKEMVLELNNDELSKVIRKSTSKRISEKRVAHLVDKLTEMTKQSYCAVVSSATFVGFNLPIKSTLLSALTSDIMSQGTFLPRNTSLNVGILMLERFSSSVFTISLRLATPILAISLISMRNEKDNRKSLQLSHIRLPLYIVSFGQCITPLRITNFTITI